jgi:lipopolysaccharide export LptBFGC system permease protein LptF
MLSITFDIRKLLRAFRSRKGVDDMTIRELILRRRLSDADNGYAAYRYGLRLLEFLSSEPDTDPEETVKGLTRASSAIGSIEAQQKKTAEIRTAYLFEIHKRLVLSASCLAFAVFAVPLGIRFHRRERSVNILIGIGIALLYYALILIVEKSPFLLAHNPHLIIWIPPIACLMIGLRLFTQLRRGHS